MTENKRNDLEIVRQIKKHNLAVIDEVLNGLKDNKAWAWEVLRKHYWKTTLKVLVKKRINPSLMDKEAANDVLIDSILALRFNKITDPDKKFYNLDAYMYRIIERTWYTQWKELDKYKAEVKEDASMYEDAVMAIENYDKYEKQWKIIKTVFDSWNKDTKKHDCQDLIFAKHLYEIRFKQLEEELKKSANNLRVIKKRCMDKLIEAVKLDPRYEGL